MCRKSCSPEPEPLLTLRGPRSPRGEAACGMRLSELRERPGPVGGQQRLVDQHEEEGAGPVEERRQQPCRRGLGARAPRLRTGSHVPRSPRLTRPRPSRRPQGAARSRSWRRCSGSPRPGRPGSQRLLHAPEDAGGCGAEPAPSPPALRADAPGRPSFRSAGFSYFFNDSHTTNGRFSKSTVPCFDKCIHSCNHPTQSAHHPKK